MVKEQKFKPKGNKEFLTLAKKPDAVILDFEGSKYVLDGDKLIPQYGHLVAEKSQISEVNKTQFTAWGAAVKYLNGVK
jgi:hypothetical protein